MKYCKITVCLLSVVLFLNACGGGGGSHVSTPASPAVPITPTPSTPPPPPANVSGNWQFSATSSAGMTPIAIAGSLDQSGSSVRGAIHISGSTCFDNLIPVALTGTLSDANLLALTSASVSGQVITINATALTDSIAGNAFTTGINGRYAISGGCANGDQGSVAGFEPGFANLLSGTFTSSAKKTFDVSGDDLAQAASASSEGSFAVTGTVSFGDPCFGVGTINPGTLPSGSFVIGASLALEIQTNNGTVTFLGTLNRVTGEFSGNYTVGGGTCDQTGTAVLTIKSPWDY